MDINIEMVTGIASGLFGAGVVWGGMRARMNALERAITHEREGRIAAHNANKREIDVVQADVTHHRERTTDRLARIETKIDLMLKKEGLLLDELLNKKIDRQNSD